MGFARDNVEFTEDNIDTEMELFTVIDESSVGSRFYRSGRVLRIFVGSLRVRNYWSGVQGSGLWNVPCLEIFSSIGVGIMKVAGLLTTNRPLHPNRNTGAWGDQPEGLPMVLEVSLFHTIITGNGVGGLKVRTRWFFNKHCFITVWWLHVKKQAVCCPLISTCWCGLRWWTTRVGGN